jgi:MFS family permease
MTETHRDKTPYRGAPTRAGRIILFFFGLPFILGGVLMLGGAFFGQAGEWLAMLLGGSAFLIVGLIVWRPAFPKVVNRLRYSKNPIIKWGVNKGGRHGFSLLILIMSVTPMLIVVGIIPTQESEWPAPRWVAIVASGLFLVGGLYFLLQKHIQRLDPGLRKQIMGLIPLLIVTGMAVIADWIAFGSGERAFSMSGFSGMLGIHMGGDELVGRIAFGAGGIFLSVIALIGWMKNLLPANKKSDIGN